MSERIHFPEQGPEDDKPYGEHIELHQENTPEKHESKHGSKEELEKLLEKIETEARSAKEIKADKLDKKVESEHTHSASLHIKSHGHGSAKPSLQSVQSQLNTPERVFSRTIHNKTIERVSEAAGATIARPSGLLGGAVCSFTVSLIVLIICRYYGYQYNFLLGIASFGGGFVLGLLIETIVKVAKR